MDQELITDLVTANRIVANEEIIKGFGHVSVRAPGGDSMYISRSISPSRVTEDDLMEMAFDGEILENPSGGSAYKETVIHRAIYRNRPDVHAVVHHHDDAIMPFTIVDVPIEPAFHNAAPFKGGVPVFSDLDDEFGKLVVNEAEGERMAENLGDRYAQLIHAHGANVVGPGLRETVVLTAFFVMNARYQYRALQLDDAPSYYGGSDESFRSMTEEVVLAPVVIDRKWDYLAAKLD